MIRNGIAAISLFSALLSCSSPGWRHPAEETPNSNTCPKLSAESSVIPDNITKLGGQVISQALFGGKLSGGAVGRYGSVNVFQMLFTLDSGQVIPGLYIAYIGKLSQTGIRETNPPRFWIKLNGQELAHDQLLRTICVGSNCYRSASYVDHLDAEIGSIPFFDPNFGSSSGSAPKPLECQNQPSQAHLFDKALSASNQSLPSWDVQVAIEDMNSREWDNNNDVNHNYHVTFPAQADLSHPKMTILAPPGPPPYPGWP